MASLAQRAKHDPALLARALKDPGLRSKLPVSLLTPELRQGRQNRLTQAAIGNPLAPLQGNTLQHLARTIVDADYQPAFSDLDRSRGQTVQDTGELGRRAQDYFAGLAGVQQNAVTGTQQGATDLDTRLKQIADDQAAKLSGVQQQGQQAIQADQAVRGGGLQADAASKLAQTIAAAQSQAAAGSTATRTAAAEHGATAADLARGMASAGAQRGGETQGNIALGGQAQLAQILAKRQGLTDQRRGDYTKTLMDLRQNQADTQLAAQTLLGGQASDAAKIGLDTAEAQERARHNRASESNQRNDPSKKKTQAELDFFHKHGFWPPTGPPKKGAGADWASPKDQGKAADTIGKALTYAKTMKQQKITRQQAGQILLAGQKSGGGQPVYDTKTGQRKLNPDGTQATTGGSSAIPSFEELWASVALDLAYDGHISGRNVKKLHDRKIKINSLGYPTGSTKASGAAGYDKGSRPG